MVLSAFPLASLVSHSHTLATLADGSPLPSWLTFNPSTRTFSGKPPQDVTGEIEIRISARDKSNLVGSDTFKLTITPVNDAPVVSTPVADQSVAEDTTWSFQVPAGAFTDVDNASLTYTASLASGSTLPSWSSRSTPPRALSEAPRLRISTDPWS